MPSDPRDELYAFDATLHRLADVAPPGPLHVDLWGTWPTLAAEHARAAAPFATGFDEAFARLDRLERMFTEPDGSFPRALAMAWAFIRPASTPRKKTDVPPPSVGPYRISDYQRNKLVTIVREPTWKKNVAAGVPETPDENNVDQMTVRIGVPEYAGGLADVVRTPRFATALGLLEEARMQRLRGRKVAEQSGSFKETLRRMKEWFLGNF